MSSGDLRYKIGFYQREAIGYGSPPIDYGNSEGQFPDTATFIAYGNIMPRLGGESIQAARLTGRNFVNITVRKNALTNLVTPEWMAKNETTGQVFNIRSVIDPNQENARHGFYWEMLCEEGVAT